MKKIFIFLLTIGPLFTLWSCNQQKSTDNQEKTNLDTIDLSGNFEKAKRIFYNLPSPPDIANILLDNKELKFDETMLNPLTNVEMYGTSSKQAVNLGVYSTDFCFASIYGQDQIALNYFAISRKLSRELGIQDVVGKDTIQWLAKNFENKDSLIDMITVVYRRTESYFNENGKYDLALLMAMGGWVEGLHLATNLLMRTPYNNELRAKIIEQKLSMELIMQILNKNKNQPALNVYYKEFEAIDNLYKKLNEKNLNEALLSDFTKTIDDLRAKMMQ